MDKISKKLEPENFTHIKNRLKDFWDNKIPGGLIYMVPNQDWRQLKKVKPKGIYSDDYMQRYFKWTMDNLNSRIYGHDDAVPLIQPWFSYGGAALQTGFGAEYNEEKDHTAPRIENIEDIKDIDLDPSLEEGLVGKSLDIIKYMVGKTNGSIPVQMYSIGGTMTIASLVCRDSAIFEGFYTNPKKVHRLLESCTRYAIKYYKKHAEIIPEFLPTFVHDLYRPYGYGISYGADWLIGISPEHAIEFEVPYINWMSDEFGGVFVHSCGNIAPKLELLKKHVKNLKGIYFKAGESSFAKAVKVFRGTDVVLILRWGLNSPYSFKSRLDYVKKILSMKTHDIKLVLLADYCAQPEFSIEEDPISSTLEIAKYIENYKESV